MFAGHEHKGALDTPISQLGSLREQARGRSARIEARTQYIVSTLESGHHYTNTRKTGQHRGLAGSAEMLPISLEADGSDALDDADLAAEPTTVQAAQLPRPTHDARACMPTRCPHSRAHAHARTLPPAVGRPLPSCAHCAGSSPRLAAARSAVLRRKRATSAPGLATICIGGPRTSAGGRAGARCPPCGARSAPRLAH